MCTQPCSETLRCKIVNQERSEPVMEPPVYLPLESEPRELELHHTEREVRALRDVRGSLHAVRDEIARVNALVNDSALETLSMIAERMSILANEVNVPLRGIALIARPDVSPTGGRPQLERQEMYTRARIRKQMRRRSQSAETVQVNPEDILLCFQEDPVLPEDMDPEETRCKGKIGSGCESTTRQSGVGSMAVIWTRCCATSNCNGL
ncbi:hypothetical protein COOONC_19332 [Cooperia oncophora]